VLDAGPDIEVVGEAADGLQAVDETRRLPHVVLMDVRMPNLDGLEATRRLAGPAVTDPACVLILTTYDVDEYVVAALRAGACGLVLKHTSPEGLVEAVRTWNTQTIAPKVAPRLSRFSTIALTGTTTEPVKRNSSPKVASATTPRARGSRPSRASWSSTNVAPSPVTCTGEPAGCVAARGAGAQPLRWL
jgi:DNA-binding NarL/FixJ family response regulator